MRWRWRARPALRAAHAAAHAVAQLGFAAAALAAPLPRLALDPASVTVSGLSSGGFMAVQFQVTHSSRVAGAAVLAGGPYFCSAGNLEQAGTVCSCTLAPAWPPGAAAACPTGLAASASFVQGAVDAALAAGLTGAIDAPSNLARQRVWLFSSAHDATVPAAVVDGLEAFYRRLGVVRIARVRRLSDDGVPDRAVGHAMPTLARGNACESSAPPFINRCGYDAAGRLLAWLYPDLGRRAARASAAALTRFDQTAFVDRQLPHGLADEGLVYVPAACRRSAVRCRLHVVFHGCRQGLDYPMPDGSPSGERFARLAGYDEWAEANRLVVLYPQVAAPGADARIVNPRGCWDFWGYTGADFAVRSARQIGAVRRMVDRLLASP